MYDSPVSPTLYNVEAHLYVQEAQLDKFRKELDASTIVANISHTSQEENSFRGTFSGNNGRGNRYNCGCGRGRGRHPTGNRSTCQLCGKYDHSVMTCWNRFDENSMPHSVVIAQSSPTSSSDLNQETPQDGS